MKGSNNEDYSSPHKLKTNDLNNNFGISVKEYSYYLKSKQMNTIGGKYN